MWLNKRAIRDEKEVSCFFESVQQPPNQRVAQERFPILEHRRSFPCAVPYHTTTVCCWPDHRPDGIPPKYMYHFNLRIDGPAPAVCKHARQLSFVVAGGQHSVVYVPKTAQHNIVASPRTTCLLPLRPEAAQNLVCHYHERQRAVTPRSTHV